MPIIIGGSAALGLGSSLIDRADKKKQKKDSGNAWTAVHGESEKALKDYLTRDAQAGSREVMQDPVYKQMYGEGGQLGLLGQDIASQRAEESDLRSKGFSLGQDDREAYGQMAGDLTRQFGQSQNNLASALRARGLSASGSANTAFAGSMGNKMEQLAGLQRKIAQDKIQNTIARLGQTRSHINNLLGNQQGMVGQYGQALAHKDQFAESKGKMGQENIGNMQQQANLNFDQQKASHVGSFLGSAAKGAMGGAMAGAQMMAGPGGGQLAGMFGGGGSSVSPSGMPKQGFGGNDKAWMDYANPNK